MKGWRLVLFLLVGLCFSGLSLAQEQASNYWQDAKQVTDNKAVNPTPQTNDPGRVTGVVGVEVEHAVTTPLLEHALNSFANHR